jgi:hypothetical protein
MSKGFTLNISPQHRLTQHKRLAHPNPSLTLRTSFMLKPLKRQRKKPYPLKRRKQEEKDKNKDEITG